MKPVLLRPGERLLWRWHAGQWYARNMGNGWTVAAPSLDDALRQVLTATRIAGDTGT